jgi:hypothetical protein
MGFSGNISVTTYPHSLLYTPTTRKERVTYWLHEAFKVSCSCEFITQTRLNDFECRRRLYICAENANEAMSTFYHHA